MSIIVKYEGQYFEAGKEVVGSIFLTVEEKKPVELKSFKLDLVLEIQGRWPGGMFSDNKLKQENKAGNQMIIDLAGSKFEAGIHEIPFRYPLGENLPATCSQQCKSGQVSFSYRLKVEGVKKSTFSFNINGNVPVFISDNRSLPLVGACMSETLKAKKFCCISKGVSSIDASIDQTAFVIGRDQAIPVIVSFKNNTQYACDRIQVRIMYTLYMAVRNGNEEAWISAAQEVAVVTLPVCIKPDDYVDNLVIQCPMPAFPWRCHVGYKMQTTSGLVVEAAFVDDEIKPNAVGACISVHS